MRTATRAPRGASTARRRAARALRPRERVDVDQRAPLIGPSHARLGESPARSPIVARVDPH